MIEARLQGADFTRHHPGIYTVYMMGRTIFLWSFLYYWRIVCVVLKCNFATFPSVSWPARMTISRLAVTIWGFEAPFGKEAPTILDRSAICFRNVALARTEAASTTTSSSARGRCSTVIYHPTSCKPCDRRAS